jgi:lipopolysaccharide export system permease protein
MLRDIAQAGPRASRQIDRYLLRQLAVALVAVTGGLVALIWLTQSLRFVELVVNRGLSLRVFLELTSLLIPNFVAVILPITTFIVQFVYQRLAGDRELTVMRAAGLSPLALARPALVLATVAMAACFLLNVWVVPTSFAAFRQFQFEIRNRVAAFLLQEGVFTPVSDDLVVYVRARDPDGTLHGIMVDDDRDKTSHATILAERGRLVSGDDGAPRVLLFHGSRQELDKQTGRLNILTFSQNALNLSADRNGDQQRYRDATEMSLSELLDPPPGIVAARDLPKLLVEAHRRLATPVTAVSFAMVALVAVLMGNFRRHGNLLRPLLAVLLVVGLLAAGLAIVNLAQRSPALLPLIWVQAIAPGAVGMWLLLRGQRRPLPLPRLRLAGAGGG